MRRLRDWIWLIVLGSVIVIFLGPFPAGAVPVVRVQPSIPIAGVGSRIGVVVEVSSVTDLYACQFDILFDPAILSVESVGEGSFLPSGGDTSFVPGGIDNNTGMVIFTVDSLFDLVPGVNGGGSLAILEFYTLASGSSPIDLSNVKLLDSSLADISFCVEGSEINVVPEPQSMILFGFGLITPLALRRRLGKGGAVPM